MIERDTLRRSMANLETLLASDANDRQVLVQVNKVEDDLVAFRDALDERA